MSFGEQETSFADNADMTDDQHKPEDTGQGETSASQSVIRNPQSALDTFRPDPPTPPLHRLAVRTPFAVGPVNVYVVEDAEHGLTLVDTGPNTDEAWADLEAGLAARGQRVAD